MSSYALPIPDGYTIPAVQDVLLGRFDFSFRGNGHLLALATATLKVGCIAGGQAVIPDAGLHKLGHILGVGLRAPICCVDSLHQVPDGTPPVEYASLSQTRRVT